MIAKVRLCIGRVGLSGKLLLVFSSSHTWFRVPGDLWSYVTVSRLLESGKLTLILYHEVLGSYMEVFEGLLQIFQPVWREKHSLQLAPHTFGLEAQSTGH
jgi:hypothetical protein